MQKNNIAAVYIRVSSDRQTEYSPDAQLKAIKDYARKNDLEIDAKYIFKDEGISGRKAEKRPEFMRMIATAKTKPSSPFSKILVHKSDRFSRSREDSVVYKSLLKKECNVDVISITEDFGNDKFSVIMEAMLEAMAEYYSLNLSDEVYKGMKEKGYRGEWQAKAPLGYDMVNSKLIINEKEEKIIKMIFNEYLNNTTIRQICNKLKKLNIKNKLNNDFEHRTIEYILRNPIYCGKVRWCPYSKNSWNFEYREKNSIIIDGSYPKIISEEDFNLVQERIHKTKEKYKHITSDVQQHWLRKLVKCSSCGGTIAVLKNNMQCINYSHSKCYDSHYISTKTMANAILEQLKIDFNNPIDINIVAGNNEQKNHLNELDLIKEQIKIDTEKLDRVKNLYIEGIDTINEYKENKKKIEDHLNDLKKQLQTIDVSIHETSLNQDFSIKAKNLYELITNESVSMDIKYTAVHNLIDKAIYNKRENTLEIYYKC